MHLQSSLQFALAKSLSYATHALRSAKKTDLSTSLQQTSRTRHPRSFGAHPLLVAGISQLSSLLVICWLHRATQGW